MDIQVKRGSIQDYAADTLIVNLLEGVDSPQGATGAVNKALKDAVREMIDSGDLSGELGKVGVVYPRGAIPAKRVIIVGLGKQEDLNLEAVRIASGTAIQKARELNANQVATIVHGAGLGGLELADAAQATVEGSLLALYTYDAPKQRTKELHEIQSLTVVEYDSARLNAIEAGAQTAKAIATGVYLARDLINMPPNVATPTRMAAAARQIAEEHNMILTVGDREWAARRNMGAYLAVAQGAEEPPMFIVLEHHGDNKDMDTVVLVGKGITFDSGGISLKPSERMGAMKSDMSGAAAVLGAMKAVGLLELPLRVIGIAPCTENKPDAKAYLPADVITASNGKTIEIISTDAEGRMVLADALVYAAHYSPKAVIDLATLTGACVIALGEGVAAGLFSNDEVLRDRLVESGNKAKERVWPMPLFEDYRESIDSQVADIKNSGGRFGGVGTSAIFLKEFTDYVWAHVDMAGMALTEKGNAYTPKGATGFGVRLLVEYLRNL
jgi:leucyl aminopeptidase